MPTQRASDALFMRASLRMSRAMNLSIDMAAAISLCDRNAIRISTIEPLDSGGTRIVLMTTEGARNLQRVAKDRIIEGPVLRSGTYQARPPIPYG